MPAYGRRLLLSRQLAHTWLTVARQCISVREQAEEPAPARASRGHCERGARGLAVARSWRAAETRRTCTPPRTHTGPLPVGMRRRAFVAGVLGTGAPVDGGLEPRSRRRLQGHRRDAATGCRMMGAEARCFRGHGREPRACRSEMEPQDR